MVNIASRNDMDMGTPILVRQGIIEPPRVSDKDTAHITQALDLTANHGVNFSYARQESERDYDAHPKGNKRNDGRCICVEWQTRQHAA